MSSRQLGAAAVAQRVIRAGAERALARDRRDAVGREDLGAQDFGRQIAHAARRAVREQVADGGVPGVAEPGVLDVDGEIAPLPQIHRRRARLRDDEHRRGDRQRRRDCPTRRAGAR